METFEYEAIIEQKANLLKACGHPIRLKMLCKIENEHNCCVGDLWQCLDEKQAVISQHLAILKKANIVKSEIKANKRIYTISDPFIKATIQFIFNDL